MITIGACALAAASASAAPLDGTASMVAAIPSVGAGSEPSRPTTFAGALFFGARDSEHGGELWRSDGTQAGTALLTDLVPGVNSSDPNGFAIAGGKLFFVAAGGLWVTDGTAAGAQKLVTLNIGSTNSTPILVASGSRVFFNGTDDAHGSELWTSDGTVGGTKLITDLCPGDCGQPNWMTAFAGGVMFTGNDGGAVTGSELYFSDGNTVALVKDIQPGSANSVPHDLAVLGDKLYFAGNDGSGSKLWVSDGTSLGTAPVASSPTAPDQLVVTGTRMFFVAGDATNGRELWTMTTTTGPTIVSNITSGGSSSSIDSLGVAGSNAYFRVNNPTPTFWVSDGSDPGTKKLLALPADDSFVSPPVELNGDAYFSAATPATGRELFRSNGTFAGTTVLKDINPGAAPSEIFAMTAFGGALYFAADDGLHGSELWRSDGTADGTAMLKDINGADEGVWPVGLAPFASGLIFSARSLAGGYEPWRSDGTAAGTVALGELRPGFQPVDWDAAPDGYTPIAGGAMVFAGNDIDHGRELWRVGSGGDVSLVMDIRTGPDSSEPTSFVAAGGLAYFLAQGATGKYALWRTDGTLSGTVMLDDLGGNDTSGQSVHPVALGSEIVYRKSGTGDLWKSDGSVAGTVKLASGPVEEHAASGDTVWYVADRTLWKTTASPGSASEVAPLPATSALDSPIVVSPSGPFFALGTYDTHWRYALWHSDGTVAGTHSLVDLETDGGHSEWQLAWVAGQLYFIATDADHGLETWVSDGSVAGTRLLLDRVPGPANGEGRHFIEHLGHVFFLAYDDAGGYNALWQSDGTAAGTVKASDAHLDDDAGFVSIGDTLYFSGGDNVHGQQLWTWKPSPTPATTGGGGGGGTTASAPPVISALKLSRRSFLAATKGASAVAARTKPGTIVSYKLSTAATVRFTVQRLRKGRRSGRRCVKATAKNRRAKSCTRVIAVRGSFSRRRTAGADRFRFTGRMAGKRLAVGRYRLTVTPRAGGISGKPARATFTIRRKA